MANDTMTDLNTENIDNKQLEATLQLLVLFGESDFRLQT